MITLSVKINDTGDDELGALLSRMSGPERAECTAAAASAASRAARDYHIDFNKSGKWLGNRYLGRNAGGGSKFGETIASGWRVALSDESGATIENPAPFYAIKVFGGRIEPKRAKALTIPIIPEARGLTAAMYEQETGHKLFTIRGRNALFEKVDSGGSESVIGKQYGAYKRGKRAIVGRRALMKRGQEIRAVFALKKFVIMDPWPGARPPDDDLISAFKDQYIVSLLDL